MYERTRFILCDVSVAGAMCGQGRSERQKELAQMEKREIYLKRVIVTK